MFARRAKLFVAPPPRKHRYCIHGIIYHRVLFAEIYFGVEILKITRRGGSTFKGRKKSFTRKRKLLAILYIYIYIVSRTFKLEKKKKKRKKRKIILTAVQTTKRNILQLVILYEIYTGVRSLKQSSLVNVDQLLSFARGFRVVGVKRQGTFLLRRFTRNRA